MINKKEALNFWGSLRTRCFQMEMICVMWVIMISHDQHSFMMNTDPFLCTAWREKRRNWLYEDCISRCFELSLKSSQNGFFDRRITFRLNEDWKLWSFYPQSSCRKAKLRLGDTRLDLPYVRLSVHYPYSPQIWYALLAKNLLTPELTLFT
jgi:hypothetical protein